MKRRKTDQDFEYDSLGIRFEFSAYELDTKEYAKLDNRYYLYFFENHGFNDYNIVERYEF